MYEAVANTVIGWVINYTANLVVLPMFGCVVSYVTAFYIGVVFTVISVVRSYVLRRLFNNIRSYWNTEDTWPTTKQ